jgi:hypothetical protein
MEKTLEQLEQEMRDLVDAQVRRMQAEHRDFLRRARRRFAFLGILILAIAELDRIARGGV